jgi:hypothetical protein
MILSKEIGGGGGGVRKAAVLREEENEEVLQQEKEGGWRRGDCERVEKRVFYRGRHDDEASVYLAASCKASPPYASSSVSLQNIEEAPRKETSLFKKYKYQKQGSAAVRRASSFCTLSVLRSAAQSPIFIGRSCPRRRLVREGQQRAAPRGRLPKKTAAALGQARRRASKTLTRVLSRVVPCLA